MPFPDLYLIHQKLKYKKNPKKIKETKVRKEKDLHMTLPPDKLYRTTFRERASAFTSGSITIEASFALPLFFLAAVCVVYLLEIMAIQTAVRSGLHYAGKNTAQNMYSAVSLRPAEVETDMVAAIGADRLNRSIITGGSGGLHLEESYASAAGGIAVLTVSYEVSLPIPLFITGGITYRDEIRIKGWTGYARTGFTNESEETVYVTETGLVYHRDYHCTHLDLSIRMVTTQEVSELRNQSGGKYHACERCGSSSGEGAVYITNTGTRYHSQVGCSGLKRSVYAIPISEAIGKGACSRCSQ